MGKVPSDITYNVPRPSTPSIDGLPRPPPSPGAEYKWGFEVPATDPHRLSWVKILLDPTQTRPTFVQPKKTVLPRGKTPFGIVTDYLRALRGYTLLTVERRLGAAALRAATVEYVLTVPAVWSDKARATTLEAAVAAGLGGDGGAGLRLITEPEGAAEYTLRNLRADTLKTGDCFTVCDAGGGTVDLITYTIASLKPLVLKEVAVGTGALCGAVYLDRRFEEFVVAIIGRERFDGMDPRAKAQMMRGWERDVKHAFTEEGEEDYWVPAMGLLDSPDTRVRGGFFRISR